MLTPLRLLWRKIFAYQDEMEFWKVEHEAAMAFFRFDDFLADGVTLFEAITRVDETWRARVLEGLAPYEPAVADQIKHAYRWWLESCEAVESQLAEFEKEFGPTENGGKFRQCLVEARGILTPDEEFFSGDALVKARDAAIDAYRKGETDDLYDAPT